ncbi:fimbria/pilus outer membrane usher protein [Shigella flexneri]
MQREGHTRYSITAGEYRSGNAQQEKPRFFQTTLLHGLPAGWTIYGGTQLADCYWLLISYWERYGALALCRGYDAGEFHTSP